MGCHLLEKKNGHPHIQLSVLKTNCEIDIPVFWKFCRSYYKNVGYGASCFEKPTKVKCF